jgi:hypothetical protein
VTLLTALLTLWVTSRRDDRARNQQAAAEAVASFAGLAVHLAGLAVHLAGLVRLGAQVRAERRQQLRNSDNADLSPETRQLAATLAEEWEAMAKDIIVQMSGIQRDYSHAQSLVTLLVPGAEQAMIRLPHALPDPADPAVPDIDAVVPAANDFLAAARKALRIRGGGWRATIPGSSPAEESSRSAI